MRLQISNLIIASILVIFLSSTTHGFVPLCNNSPLNHNYGTQSSSTGMSMFTGIVEEMGEVVNLEQRDDMVLWDGSTGKGTELTVKADVIMDGAYLG